MKNYTELLRAILFRHAAAAEPITPPFGIRDHNLAEVWGVVILLRDEGLLEPREPVKGNLSFVLTTAGCNVADFVRNEDEWQTARSKASDHRGSSSLKLLKLIQELKRIIGI